MQGKTIVLALATTATGLVAGVFYGFSVAVNPALAYLPDESYLAAMQAINRVIQNPLFAASFFGAPFLLPWATALYAQRPHTRRFWLLAAATAVYWVGGFGVTVGVNIPLNEKLAAFSLAQASPAQAAQARADFAPSWNHWHTIRTLASVAALGLVVAAGLSAAHENTKVYT